MKRFLAILGVLFAAFVLTCGLVNAYSVTFSLPAGEEDGTKSVSMNAGDEISGHVTVIPSAINFSISNPDGDVFLNYSGTQIDFRFTASKTGTYTFYFNNTLSDEDKSVTFNYNVQHYIFGFPQEYVILFAIVGLSLVAVVVFIAMSPKP